MFPLGASHYKDDLEGVNTLGTEGKRKEKDAEGMEHPEMSPRFALQW